MTPPETMNGYRILLMNDDWSRHILIKDTELKKKEEAEEKKLPELPPDVFGEILSRISSIDGIRYGATCRNNKSLVKMVMMNQSRCPREVDELPWLATFDRWDFKSPLRLYDPIHRRGQPPYSTFTIGYPKQELDWSYHAKSVKASKNGWLLFLWPKGHSLISIFLFSPFNRRFIELPDLRDGIVHCPPSTLATFSSDPSSPDCVYFVLIQNVIPGKVIISTLQNNSWEWKTLEFDNLIDAISSVAYHDGCFYCVSDWDGNLAAYDYVQKNWTIVVSSSPFANMWFPSCRNFYILECDGNLILVCLKNETSFLYEKNTTNEIRDWCRLFKLNSYIESWVEKKTSLGDHAIFIGNKDCTTFAVSVPWWPEIANNVYFFCDYSLGKCPKYYSFKDRKFYRCPSGNSSCWSSDIQDGIWIQPRARCITQNP